MPVHLNKDFLQYILRIFVALPNAVYNNISVPENIPPTVESPVHGWIYIFVESLFSFIISSSGFYWLKGEMGRS